MTTCRGQCYNWVNLGGKFCILIIYFFDLSVIFFHLKRGVSYIIQGDGKFTEN